MLHEEDGLDLGGLELNFDFLEVDDPYYDKERLEVDTHKLFDYHKKEVVKQNVEFRVPPPVDKKSLHHRYETLSMKKMKLLLNHAKSRDRPNTSALDNMRNMRKTLQKELKEEEREWERATEDEYDFNDYFRWDTTRSFSLSPFTGLLPSFCVRCQAAH